MSLALLSGVNPRACKNETGPKVRIHEGKWRLVCVGLVDTVLTLYRQGDLLAQEAEHGTEFEGNCTVSLYIAKRGTEQHFSVFAELVTNGTVISTT